jgi:glycosyltransferase involved in cell wall biosynthesis
LVTIVIPTFNEQQAIGKVLDELFFLGLKNILVVDGYSSDGTLYTAKKYSISLIFQHGKGKAGALKTAFENVKTPYMMVMDGDFTYDPSCIHRFLEHMQSYDQIIGVRNLDVKKNISTIHKLGNKIITTTFNALMGTSLSDVCSGMYVLRTEIVKDMDLSSTGFDVEVEIAGRIASSGRVTEIPINYRQRIGKQKLSTWKHGFKILYTILKLGMTYKMRVFYYRKKLFLSRRATSVMSKIAAASMEDDAFIECPVCKGEGVDLEGYICWICWKREGRKTLMVPQRNS